MSETNKFIFGSLLFGVILFCLWFAIFFPVNAGIYPWRDYAFPAWGWNVSHETPSLYYDIHRETVYTIKWIQIDPKTGKWTAFASWDK
jgi:hypothetical protein